MRPENARKDDGEHIAPGAEFEQLARKGGRGLQGSALTQMVVYVLMSRRWWLLPVVLALLAMGLLVVVGTSSAAPFIYALF